MIVCDLKCCRASEAGGRTRKARANAMVYAMV